MEVADEAVGEARSAWQCRSPAVRCELPLVSWTLADLATRDDVQSLAIALRGEMSELRGELHGEMSELRGELHGEMTELRAALRAEMATGFGKVDRHLGEMRGEIAKLSGELRAEFSRQILMLGAILLAVLSLMLTGAFA